MGINVLFLAVIVVYSFTIIGFLVDFIESNQKIKRLSFWLLVVVWSLQLMYLVLRFIEFGRLPIMTLFEGMFFYTWILVTISIFLMIKRFSFDFLVLIINLIGFTLLTISLLAPAGDISPRLAELLQIEMLVIHVTILFLSYSAFTISFASSLLYFLQHHLLKKKKWSKRMSRIGNLSQLEKRSYRFILIGVPLMVTGVILGIIWTAITYQAVPWYDSKVISSFISIAIYSVYLFQYKVKQ